MSDSWSCWVVRQLNKVKRISMLLFFVEIYCVITTALWSRGDSAVVSVHSPAAIVVYAACYCRRLCWFEGGKG